MRPNGIGALGETLAEGWLKERGFRILDRPNKYAHYDFLVERRGKREYVEVKTKRVTGTGEDRRHDIRPEGMAFWNAAEHPVRFLLVFVDFPGARWWVDERRLRDFRRTGIAKWKLVAPPPRRPREVRALPERDVVPVTGHPASGASADDQSPVSPPRPRRAREPPAPHGKL